jgi:triphosphoribosyl-dephospho-CoA synthase
MPEQIQASEWRWRIADAFEQACRDELDSPKPGNVHVFANGHQMSVRDFELSAMVSAGPLTLSGQKVGARILGAVEASVAAANRNTNLGIILLCAPLAAAADTPVGDLPSSVSRVLQKLDREDAELAFRAIVHASPGGLGRSNQHDVFAPATATLRETMAAAAHRDRIALQYVTDFADVFSLGDRLLSGSLAVASDRRLATLATYLGFLEAFPDSHIVRKHGPDIAEQIRREASHIGDQVRRAERLEDILPDILAWDATLKLAGINPGTSADLTVATLFAHRLRNILPIGCNSD